MKKYLFALPVLATAAAIAANLPGFVTGGLQPWWTLAVTMGCSSRAARPVFM